MKISYTASDGKLSIVSAAPKTALERVLGPMTDEEYREHVLDRSIPAGAADVTILPDDWTCNLGDRTFRDAWRMQGGKVSVDMGKARDIQRDRIRLDRAPRLEALDVEALKALEANDAVALAHVKARKQRLRDAPAHPDIDAAKTPEQLKSITLDKLASS